MSRYSLSKSWRVGMSFRNIGRFVKNSTKLRKNN